MLLKFLKAHFGEPLAFLLRPVLWWAAIMVALFHSQDALAWAIAIAGIAVLLRRLLRFMFQAIKRAL